MCGHVQGGEICVDVQGGVCGGVQGGICVWTCAGRRVCVGICEEGNVCRKGMFVCAEGVRGDVCGVDLSCISKQNCKFEPRPHLVWEGGEVNFKMYLCYCTLFNFFPYRIAATTGTFQYM